MTYPLKGSPFQQWELANPLARHFLLALLSTFISFQLTTIFFELVFGFKTPGVAKVQDLHMKLLANERSPVKIVDSLLRHDWFTLFVRGQLGNSDTNLINTNMIRDERSIHQSTALKLLMLLVVGPVVNIIVFLMGVEKDVSFTFEDLGVKTLQLGVTKDAATRRTTLDCSSQDVVVQERDKAQMNFSICRLVFRQGAREYTNTNPDFNVTVSFHRDFSINLLIQSESKNLDWQIYGLMIMEEGRFRVSPSYKKIDLQRFLNIAKKLLENKCKYDDQEFVEKTNLDSSKTNSMSLVTQTSSENNGLEVLSQKVQRQWRKRRSNLSVKQADQGPTFVVMESKVEVHCQYHISAEEFLHTADEIWNHIGFVNGSSFTVVKEEIVKRFANTVDEDKVRANSERGEKLPFLSRQESNVSLFTLIMIASSIMFFRIMVHFFCYDDLLFGIENVLRENFGVGRLDSMLQCDDVIDIDDPLGVKELMDKDSVDDYDDSVDSR